MELRLVNKRDRVAIENHSWQLQLVQSEQCEQARYPRTRAVLHLDFFCVSTLLLPLVVLILTSSSCRAASTNIPDPLSPLLPIVHRLWQVFRATSRILTELLNVCSSWPSCFCPAIWGGPSDEITYELFPASPAVSCMSGSSNLDSFRDGR